MPCPLPLLVSGVTDWYTRRSLLVQHASSLRDFSNLGEHGEPHH